MACRASRESVILVRLGLLVSVMSLCNCAKLTRLKALDESRETSVHTKNQPERRHLRHGRLLIGHGSVKEAKVNGTNSTRAALDVEDDYQADMGWQTKQLMEKSDWQKLAMESLLKMESKVECTQDAMQLLVHDTASTPVSLIFVDRGHLSPLSLTKLPSSCGYTVRSTQKDLVLEAPYDGCFVIIQENYYVLPLLWWGLPVRMSCPLMGYVSQNPPMVTCHAEGMVVKTEWTTSASQIKVNVNGNWESLMIAAQRCVFGLVEHPEGVVITVRYAPCLKKTDGMYTLELAADVETKVSCPSLLAAQLKLTESQVEGSVQESEMPGNWVYPFTTPYPSLFPPAQTGPPVRSFSQKPEIPNKPKQGSNPRQFPYYTPFPGFPYANLQNAEITPTKQPQTPTPSKSKATPSMHSFYHHLYPQPPFPATPQTMPPETKPPFKLNDHQLPNKYFVPLEFLHKPAASYPEVQKQMFYLSYYTKALSQLSNSYPLYLQRFPEEPGSSYPTMYEKGQGESMPFHLICSQPMAGSKQSGWTELFKGEVFQLFQLVCIQMEPPTGLSRPSNPETPEGQEYEPFYLLCDLQRSLQQPVKPSKSQVYETFYFFCYKLKRATKPADLTQSQEPTKGYLYQAFYPFYFQQSQKHTGVDELPRPITPHFQLYPQLYPFFDQSKPPMNPAVTRPPQSTTPQGPAYPPFFPFYPHAQPTQKPATQPPQSATPHGEVHPRLFPSFNEPHQKPAVTLTPQSASLQGQFFPPLFPFYSQPKQTQKPATPPSQPATLHAKVNPIQFPSFNRVHQKPVVAQQPQSATEGQVYPPLFPFYSQPKPTQKPATEPLQPVTPHAQVYQQLFPSFDKTHLKPAAPQPPQPLTPEAKLHLPLFPYFNKPSSPKPAATLPPQQATPQPQPYPPFLYFYTHPKLAPKPTVTQTPKPAASQSKVYDQFSDLYPGPKPPSGPSVSQTQQLQASKGQVSQPSYPFHLYTQSQPTSRLKAEPQPLKAKDPKEEMCVYSLLSGNWQVNIPTNPAQRQVIGPCQQSKLPAVGMSEGASMESFFHYLQPPVSNPHQTQVKNPINVVYYSQQPHSAQLGSSTSMQKLAAPASEPNTESTMSKHGYPRFCPQYCPSVLSNCCLQIAFHQHLYISAPGNIKAEPEFDTSFLPVSYSGFSQGSEAAETPPKHSSTAVPVTSGTRNPGQMSPRIHETFDANRYFHQPPGGIATLPSIENKGPVYSYFGTESLNPQWTDAAQNIELPGFEQGKLESPDDPSKLWASGNEQVKPVVQYEPFNVQFPEQSSHSRPNFMSYLAQHGLHTRELQNKPVVKQRSLHKSEYESSRHHNFKRAIDRFYSPNYMSGDSPVSNNSVGLNGSQEQTSKGSINSTKEHKAKTLRSEKQNYVLLQHGPPGGEPKHLSGSPTTFGEFIYNGNPKGIKQRQDTEPQTLESLQGERRELKVLGKRMPSHLPGNGYMQRDGEASGSFTPLSDDAQPANLYSEQSFSSEKLQPEVLNSFENFWKSLTPSDFSQLFHVNVPEKTEEQGSVLDLLASEMHNRNPKEK